MKINELNLHFISRALDGTEILSVVDTRLGDAPFYWIPDKYGVLTPIPQIYMDDDKYVTLIEKELGETYRNLYGKEFNLEQP